MARYVPKVDYGRLEFEYVPSSGFYRARISTDNSFKKDTDYAVVFDGRRYTVRSTANGAIGGNAYLYDQRKPDTGEPFYLAPAMGLVMASTAGFHSVSYGIMKADGGDNVDERLDGLEEAVVELSEEIENVSWEDLKDKPFYSYDENKVLLDKQGLEFSYQDGIDAQVATITENIALKDGVEYTVIWDGTEFTCLGTTMEYMGEEVISLGSNNVYDEQSEYPFRVICPITSAETLVLCAVSGQHSIQISGMAESVMTIDEKYLPYGTRGNFVITIDDRTGSMTYDKTKAEISAAHKAGMPIYCQKLSGMGNLYSLVQISEHRYGDTHYMQLYFLTGNSTEYISILVLKDDGTWDYV